MADETDPASVTEFVFDPGWQVTVDGQAATTEMVAPALVGVTVAPGYHTIVFTYKGSSSYPLLFAIALVTLVGVGVGWLRWRRVVTRLNPRRGTRRTPPDDETPSSEGETSVPERANSP